MTEYIIFYISLEDGEVHEGCEHAGNGQEAVRQFMDFTFDCEKILKVKRAA